MTQNGSYRKLLQNIEAPRRIQNPIKQTSKIELFAKMVNSFQPFNYKRSNLTIWLGSEYVSGDDGQTNDFRHLHCDSIADSITKDALYLYLERHWLKSIFSKWC